MKHQAILAVAASLSIVLACLSSEVGRGAAETELFPFVVSYDAPTNVTNLSGWLEQPAGKHGFVRIRDGHFVTDAGPIRFWGTNLCFEACFPTHQQAERVAARMARFGINVVRMHHMDARHIWGDRPNKLSIDPKQLERLDYLIAQLKRHGIYTNLNLHVSRWFGPAEGFVARQERPKYDKGLDNFEPRMIELQKKYAHDLLTHVNPYTGNPYAHEPAVALIEINNENAAFTSWNRGWLDTLPEPYAATYQKLWNQWLEDKYTTTARLRAAWNAGRQPLGRELLANGHFTRPLGTHWRMDRDDRTDVQWSITQEGPDGRRCLRIVVRRPGRRPWRPQLHQGGFAVKKGAAYTLSCSLRADRPCRIGVNCMMAHDPWNRLGLSASVNVGTEWQQHRFTFVTPQDDANARITFTGLKPGTYQLADISLRPGGITGLEKDERLEDASVRVLRWSQRGTTAARRRDFIDFLYETEQRYWWGMYRYLKDRLGVGSLVCGTQLSYSPVHIQAGLDYLDAHAYWQHPRFPGRPWDPNNWYVQNIAMVNSPGGTLASLAARRVAGLPFTISEYNHPEPNEFAAEGFPMLAAMAALQDWDGIYSFTYSHSTQFEPRRITGYFDIKSDPVKLVHLPACAAMFLRRDVAAAQEVITAGLSREAERAQLYETGSPRSLTADHLGVDPRLSILHRVQMDLRGQQAASAAASGQSALPEHPAAFESDTGQLRWDVSRRGAGYFAVDAPRAKLLTGFVAGRRVQLGGVALTVGRTQLGWATLSLVCIDGDGFDQPGRILIAATGRARNRDAQLQQLGNSRVTLGRQWGQEPVLCEGVPAEIELPVPAGRVRLFALDSSGSRRAPIVCPERDGHALLPLSAAHRTLWYEAEVR